MKNKLKILDSLEILSFDNQLKEYPIHFHETFCLSLIRKGVFGENGLIIPQGAILISHPYEVHTNKLIENIGVSFTTFYINQDVMNAISPYEHISFEQKMIENPFISNQLQGLIRMVTSDKRKETFELDFYTSFHQTLSILTQTYGQNRPYTVKESTQYLDEIFHYITEHLNSKINLTTLASVVGMNKFQFTRWFKSHVGITPFEFILLKRVGVGKRLIQQGVSLVDVSLDSGFYDQSHFSNYFKRYVGMSPKVYKNNCNIFQDF